jgi:hypothetical protein
MFNVARNLHAHLPAGEIENLIRAKVAGCGRAVPDREIKDAVKRSIDFAWRSKADVPGNGTDTPTAPVLADLSKIERMTAIGPRLADLWHESPVWFEDPACEYLIDRLFPGDPLICCGTDTTMFATQTREEWRGKLSQQAYLVPSTMIARTGPTSDGKQSAHAKSITGPRRFLIIEFDFSLHGRDNVTKTKYFDLLTRLGKLGVTVHDMCATLLLFLNKLRPMTLAVSSGGKSIHGWWYVLGQPEPSLRSFLNIAIRYGADPRTWWPSQFVRMPDGTRQNGIPQTVYYFNPDTLPNP